MALSLHVTAEISSAVDFLLNIQIVLFEVRIHWISSFL